MLVVEQRTFLVASEWKFIYSVLPTRTGTRRRNMRCGSPPFFRFPQEETMTFTSIMSANNDGTIGKLVSRKRQRYAARNGDSSGAALAPSSSAGGSSNEPSCSFPTLPPPRVDSRVTRWYISFMVTIVTLLLATTTTTCDAKSPAIEPQPNTSSSSTTSPHRINSPAKPVSSSSSSSTTSASFPAASSGSKTFPVKPMDAKPTVHYPTPQQQQQQAQKTTTTTTTHKDETFDDARRVQMVEQEFFAWCIDELGIDTILEIQTFEYYNHMQVMPQQDWNDDQVILEDESSDCVEDLPLLPVRGLAASRDIAAGQVVIRIPLGALLSVTTTIDKDPVLTQVMGPVARQAHGWTAQATDETSALLEVPLLAVALLYHVSLGVESPLFAYIQLLQYTPGTDAMPFLWSPTRLRQEASEGVRMVARGIARDMNDMYDAVVQVLIDQHPHLFGRHDGEEWMYSREKFQWAFAMVTTRHWQLPIQDLHGASSRRQTVSSSSSSGEVEDSGLPPASTPTDSWVEEHGVATDDHVENIRGSSSTHATNTPDDEEDEEVLVNHSFLAPFADLLNFGPPCTRGRYDSDTHSFEITALCDFKKGQEVTFYYSDECDHVVAGAYGFMHPIVPPCPSAEEYRHRSEEWQRRAEKLEENLGAMYAVLEEAEMDLDRVYEYLRTCDCCHREYKEATSGRRSPNRTDDDDDSDDRPRHEHVRGAAQYTEKDREARHGSRSGGSSKRGRWRARSGSEF